MSGIRALAVIKPDAYDRRLAIVDRIHGAKFIIRAYVEMVLSEADVTLLYGASAGKPWYAKHAAFMTSGPSCVLVLEGENAVERWRTMIGPTDPRKAIHAAPDSIRAAFGDMTQEPGCCYRNAVHGSDSDESAEREIGIFFPGLRPEAEPEKGPPGVSPLRWPTVHELFAEVDRARAKFPSRRFRLAALVEEVGELAEAIVARDSVRIHREAIQVATCAMRIAEEGDETVYRFDGFAEIVYCVGGVARFLQQRRPADLMAALRGIVNSANRMIASGDRTFNDVTDEEAKP